MKRSRILTFLILLSFAFVVACNGCNGCGDSELEASDVRISELTNLLPATADAALVIPELDKMPENLDYAFERIAQFQPEIRAYETRLNQGFGVQLTNLESWEATGFDTGGSVVVSMIGSRPVLATYIDDKNAFETNFIGRIRRILETSTAIESTTIGDRDFRISAGIPGNDMAWFYEDSIVVLVLPPLDALDLFETGSAASVAKQLSDINDENSLASTESFADFRQGIGDEFPISLYVHAGRYFDHPEAANLSSGFAVVDPLIKNLVNWSKTNAEGAGIGLRAGDQRLEIRAFAGGDEEVIEESRGAYSTVQEVEWDGFLTSNLVLAGRTGVDLPRAFQTYVESLPDDDRRALRRNISQISRNYELDVVEDILGAFTGHGLLAFYGIGGDLDALARRFTRGPIDEGITALIAQSGLMATLHTADQDKISNLLDLITTYGGVHLERRPLTHEGGQADDIELIQPRNLSNFPGRLYSSPDAITLSTAAIGENAAYQYLTNTRDRPLLADSENLELGNQFAESDGLNGLYLNFNTLRSNMRDIPIVSGFAHVLQPLHELLITAGVDDRGFYMSTILDFTDPLESDEEQ